MKPKILFILHLPPPVHGSAIVGKYIKDSVLINNVFDCKYVNLSTSVKFDEIGKIGINKLFCYLSILWKVFKHLVNWKPDLCYIAITVKGPAFYKDLMVVTLAKLFCVKLLYHFHNKGVYTRQNRCLDNLLYRFVFKNKQVIIMSRHIYSDIQKYIPEKMVHYCPNGIPEKKIIQKNSSKEDRPGILFLSNLFESKGIFVLLDACRILVKKRLNFHCTVVGRWGDITEQQFQAKLHEGDLLNYIKYLSVEHDDEKEKLMYESDIFVHPTFNDCFPLVLLEAMQNYLPIVSTFEGGIPDIVQDGITGFLVPQKNAQSLADKIEILIKNPKLCNQMGAAGRAKYEKEFTIDKFENRMVCILSKIIS